MIMIIIASVIISVSCVHVFMLGRNGLGVNKRMRVCALVNLLPKCVRCAPTKCVCVFCVRVSDMQTPRQLTKDTDYKHAA